MNTTRAIFMCVATIAATFLPQPARAESLAASFASLKYRTIGPAIAGGRVTSAVGSNRDLELYYVGGADGGVFKSTNGGA